MDSLALRAALAAGVVALLATTGGALYLLVSFLVMRRHTPIRSLRQTLRAGFMEALALAITQPLVPLCYLFGRRLGGPRGGRPVVFIHGYFQNRADFVYVARVAARAGLGPLYGFNYNWAASIPTAASRLADFVEAVCEETGRPTVAVVGHSLGGVVALEYLASAEGAARVATCVTVGSPHAGVVWRAGMIGHGARQLHARSDYMQGSSGRALPIRALSVYSTHDNIVHPKTTSSLAHRGGDDLEVQGIGHLGMLFSREVADAIVARLAADQSPSPSSSARRTSGPAP